MLFRVSYALLAILVVSACGGGTACTEIACENTATVTYPSGLITGTGAYTLMLTRGGTTQVAMCNDPEGGADNPVGLTCTTTGFELDGHAFAAARSLIVTIFVDEETVVSEQEVILQAVETLLPNGEGCDPTCVVRNGRVLEAGP